MQKIFPKNNLYHQKDAVIVDWPYDLIGLVSKLLWPQGMPTLNSHPTYLNFDLH